MTSPGDDLRAFVDASPTPYHAVAEMVRRLTAGGFTSLSEQDRWSLVPGDQKYVVREGSLLAFRIGSAPLADAGARLVGTHTDSPTFTVRPRHEVTRAGYRLVGVEPYGGLLAHTWMDRDLTVAGRVVDADGSVRLVRLSGSPLRLPSLAIHLDRAVRDGLVLDPQRHLVPVLGLESEPALLEQLGRPGRARLRPGPDRHPACRDDRLGLGDAPRAWTTSRPATARTHALLEARPAAHTQVFVANDHEEVGSGSAEGARGPFLEDVLRRLVAATGDFDPQAFHQAIARSRLVSADMAHAVHPNYSERHEPSHAPVLGVAPWSSTTPTSPTPPTPATGAWFAARAATPGCRSSTS